ncbi:hypothetical protein SLNWT_3331 [Streptomyces albus]|uniref:Uncharacterized protein n=1 Tax=Streptomyces albus (strain ATCC 21838 / DSM 41398 / FERM P-419 / JCM 4703 / NBRC 107858) TaxID=1081613 RepID=A0A0B5F055_STRA4|nr:hypothetical protein SLNWT_3331 [Streptomyces albus]AOU78014.1 hypothetical protein SLNHY_3323 [Streptomyces albus]AYN33769.1 hypothetical protein DUI70_3268 [Streptomyces albus]
MHPKSPSPFGRRGPSSRVRPHSGPTRRARPGNPRRAPRPPDGRRVLATAPERGNPMADHGAPDPARTPTPTPEHP